MQKLWFSVLILVFSFSSLHSEDFRDFFWKSSNIFPSLPKLLDSNKTIQLTSSNLDLQQTALSIYSFPIDVRDSFCVEFTLRFGDSLNTSGASGIAFNLWGIHVGCYSDSIDADTSTFQRPNLSVMKNPLLYQIGRYNFFRIKEALTLDGNLGVYNYDSNFCSRRPILSFEFDTNLDTGRTRLCTNSLVNKLDSLQFSNHIAVTKLGDPAYKYLNDTTIVNIPNNNIENGNFYKVKIEWKTTDNKFVIVIKEENTPDIITYVTSSIPIQNLLREVDATNDDYLALIGFTSTTGGINGRSPVSYYIKDFKFSGKKNINGGIY